MRDGREEWIHRHPAGRVKVSLLPSFLCLISLGGGSDYFMWLAFSYCSIHHMNIHPLSVVEF